MDDEVPIGDDTDHPLVVLILYDRQQSHLLVLHQLSRMAGGIGGQATDGILGHEVAAGSH
jgi:hypothetical protein